MKGDPKYLKIFGRSSARILTLCILLISCGPHRAFAQQPPGTDEHVLNTTLVTTEPGVAVEVLDWGGGGSPVVLLAGLGGTAHGFDSFAVTLRQYFHVYGVTRRGYGASSAPQATPEIYTADRLADDVLSVLGQLHVNRPILIGHSLAGEELSSIGSRNPGRVAGLVYLDAGYRYALSKPDMGDLQIDIITMRKYLIGALDGLSPLELKTATDNFLRELPAFQKEMESYSATLGKAHVMSGDELAKARAERDSPEGQVERAILDGEQRYGDIKSPLLAFFAYPDSIDKNAISDAEAIAEKRQRDFVDQRATLFRSLPDATVVLLPNARHAVQDSNRSEVVQQILEFAKRVKH